ncbi:PAS domain-containing protein [Flavobacterium sp. NST-5]|uniref:histidine kinase n=1 Tax=Flavobacterium ichthyis TaxID=2698827 RepID=A0ABW9Z667_9FLAO|nr:PAS domain-containing sensor histidine kinase [Flavobacterium ichthyis]NBL64169.1 PAS domain-containing protein [Flavobacterium ichthyis]
MQSHTSINSFEIFKPIVAVVHDPILILNKDYTVLLANNAFMQKFELETPSVEGHNFFELANGVFNFFQLKTLFLSINEAVPIENFEFEHAFPKVGKRVILLNINVLNDNNLNLIVISLKDISEARDIRTDQLATSRSLLQSLLNISNYGIASYEAVYNDSKLITDFKIIYTNPEVPRNFGLEQSDVLNKLCSEVYPGIFENGIFEKMAHCVKTGIGEKYETTAIVGGKQIWLQANIEKLNNGVAITSKNVTEEKLAALEIEAMNAELEKQNVELASFAYISSHDLQEPLRKIQLFSTRILEKEQNNFTEASRAYFSSIVNAAKRMQNLIESLLMYSSMDASEIKFKSLDLNKIIADIKNNFFDIIETKNVQIIATNLPKLRVIPIQFQQLISNLITNSIKYSKPDVAPIIKISAKKIISQDHNGREFWQIDVADNGIGFAQEYEHQIFELFKRLHGKTDYEGTGIGLAICKKIVQKHGGFIKAKGILGEGSVFSVFIPIK